MLRFECDYAEGCHPSILSALSATNDEQTPGYGLDPHCDNARRLIQDACQAPDADVHFLVGGTQANTTVIAAALRPYQGALCAVTGHINCHETGAVEATGHKVLPLPSDDGKITAQQIEDAWAAHWGDSTHEHIVQPGLVYLSHPTENGTTYSLSELTAISQVCRAHDLTLFLDGARLAYGLAAQPDLTLPDLARLCDVFYIGGTKVGALFGEAVVITKPELKRDFRYFIKRHGGMLAKGRLLGLQFECLMKDGLYCDLGRHAVKQALRLRAAFEQKGFPLRYDSPSNQQYPIFPDEILAKLEEKYAFSFWEKTDKTHTAVRVCTSWHTTDEQVDALIADLKSL
jgi:threonine aldolase